MKVAIVRYIRNADNYFFDLFDATIAGTLRAAGHEAVVVERILTPGFDEAEVEEGLLTFLRSFRPMVVFLSYLPSVDLPARITQATGAAIGAYGSREMLDIPGLDCVFPEPDPLSCLEFVEAMAGRGVELDRITGISLRLEDGEVHTSRKRLHPIHEIFTRGQIDYSSFFRLGPGRPAQVRKHIAGDWGCPYRNLNPRRANGSTLYPSYVPKGGCTFCTRPRSYRLPWELKQEILAVQMDKVLEAFPDVSQLILIDENALSFVDDYARFLLTRPLEGVEILISGRLDHVERYHERLEAALEVLAGRNKLCLYQFGIENLSDSALERYNKGLSFPDIARALNFIRELSARHSNLGIEPSFGFILFDPWTTPAELRENVERAREIGLDDFRSNAPFTSLRLAPEMWLYWKARQEGLLTGHVDDNDFGYAVNSGWRFKHPETEAIFHALMSRRGEAEPWDLLSSVLG